MGCIRDMEIRIKISEIPVMMMISHCQDSLTLTVPHPGRIFSTGVLTSIVLLESSKILLSFLTLTLMRDPTPWVTEKMKNISDELC